VTSAIRLPEALLLQIENALLWLCDVERPAFYGAIAAELLGHEVGPGAVGRAITKAFHQFYRPIQLTEVQGSQSRAY
jgi:hypothetical protein